MIKKFLLMFSIIFICSNNFYVKASTITTIEERDVNASPTIESEEMYILTRGISLVVDISLKARERGNLSSTVVIQKFSNGYWQNVKSFSYSKNSTLYLANTLTYKCLLNNKYRVRVTDTATIRGVTDTQTYYSDSIIF